MANEPSAAKLISLWIGGFFFWIMNGFKGKRIDQFEEKYERRNVWTGYFITLISIGLLVYLMTMS
jgi:hypothetical protein